MCKKHQNARRKTRKHEFRTPMSKYQTGAVVLSYCSSKRSGVFYANVLCGCSVFYRKAYNSQSFSGTRSPTCSPSCIALPSSVKQKMPRLPRCHEVCRNLKKIGQPCSRATPFEMPLIYESVERTPLVTTSSRKYRTDEWS